MKDHTRATRLNKLKEEKEILSLWRKKIRLMDSKRNLNKVELEKPLKWGYKKFFVLREDVAKSDDARVYLGVLPYIQSTIYCRRKDFTQKDFKTKKMIPMEHTIGTISHKKWNEIEGELTIKQKSLFQKFWYTQYHTKGKGEWRYRLIKDWMFVPKIDTHYKTHQIILDPDLESELTKLQNKLYSAGVWGKVVKYAFGGSHYERDTLRKRLIDKYYADQAHLILGYEDEDSDPL